MAVLGVTLRTSLWTRAMKELLFSSHCWYISKLTSASGVLGYMFWRRLSVCCLRTHVRDGGVGEGIVDAGKCQMNLVKDVQWVQLLSSQCRSWALLPCWCVHGRITA